MGLANKQDVMAAAPVLLLLLARGALAQAPAELADMSVCAANGFPSWASLNPYLSRLDLASPYGKSSSAPLFMPLFASHPLAGAVPDPSVTTLAIFLHGLSGAAQTYFCAGMAASAGRDALVVAPWHGDEQQNSTFWCTGVSCTPSAAAFSAYWTTSRWLTGGNISPGATGAAQFTTAFDIMDALILNATRSGLFPNLKQVSLLGFSAGSQFFSRYLWGSRLGADAAASGGVPVRAIISDPGSFLYLTPERPGAACRPLADSGGSAAPCADWAAPAPADCGGYNEYKFGIEPGSFGALNAYMAPFDGSAALRAAATAAMGKKDIVFILGEEDACNCNTPAYKNAAVCFPEGGSLQCPPDASGGAGCCDTYPDSRSSNALDTGCAAMLQGSNRLQRGLLYVQHLDRVFPARAAGPFARTIVAGMGHNNSAEYASAAFKAAAYWAPAR